MTQEQLETLNRLDRLAKALNDANLDPAYIFKRNTVELNYLINCMLSSLTRLNRNVHEAKGLDTIESDLVQIIKEVGIFYHDKLKALEDKYTKELESYVLTQSIDI